MKKMWFLLDAADDGGGGAADDAGTGDDDSGSELDGGTGGDANDLPKYQLQLKGDLQGNETLKDITDITHLAQSYIDLKGSMPIVPESSDGYDFGEPEKGADRDEAMETSFKEMAHKNQYSNEQALGAATWLNELIAERKKQVGERVAEDAKTNAAAIKKELGPEGMELAKRVITRFGSKSLSEEAFDNPEKFIETMRLAVAVGGAISESKFVDGDGGGDSTELTLDERFPDMKNFKE